MIVERATPQLIVKAASKIVSQWSRDRAASNKEAREKARGPASKKDAGAGAAPASAKKVFNADEVAKRMRSGEMSDSEWLNL